MGNNSSKGNSSSKDNNPTKTNVQTKTDIERLLDDMFNPKQDYTDTNDFENLKAQKLADEMYNRLKQDPDTKLKRIEVLKFGKYEMPYLSSYNDVSSDVISDNIIEIITCNDKLQNIIEQYRMGEKIGERKMNKHRHNYDGIFTTSDGRGFEVGPDIELLFSPNYDDIEAVNQVMMRMPKNTRFMGNSMNMKDTSSTSAYMPNANKRKETSSTSEYVPNDMDDTSSTSVFVPASDTYKMRGGADSDSTTSDSDSTTSPIVNKMKKKVHKVDDETTDDDDLEDLDKEALDEEELSEDGMIYQSDMGSTELEQLQRLVFNDGEESDNETNIDIGDLAARIFVSQTDSEQSAGNNESEYTRNVRDAMRQVKTKKNRTNRKIFNTSEEMILDMKSSTDKYMKRPLKKNGKYL